MGPAAAILDGNAAFGQMSPQLMQEILLHHSERQGKRQLLAADNDVPFDEIGAVDAAQHAGEPDSIADSPVHSRRSAGDAARGRFVVPALLLLARPRRQYTRYKLADARHRRDMGRA